MFPLNIIQEAALDKIEGILGEIDHEVTFQNPSANEWQIVISFDLDKSPLSDSEKAVLSMLLKHL